MIVPSRSFLRFVERLENNRQFPFGDEQRPYEVGMTVGKRFGQNLTFGLVRFGSVSRRDNAVSVLDSDGWVRMLNRTTGDSITVLNDIAQQLADNDRARMELNSAVRATIERYLTPRFHREGWWRAGRASRDAPRFRG